MLACLAAGSAFAACPSGPGPTNGADVDMPSGCTVTPTATTPGVTVNTSNNVTVESGATISATDVSNAVGIQVLGGTTGQVLHQGGISLLMSYAPADANGDGVPDGVFAQGSNRYGIQVTKGQFNGSINAQTASTIVVQGNDSYGIWVDPTGIVGGDVAAGSTITMTGDRTVGVNIAGQVNGSLNVLGGVSATGVGAQGVATSAPIGNGVTIQSAITATGYRSTVAPGTPTTLAALTGDELQQGGSALTIGGNVGSGINLGQAYSVTSGNTTTQFTAAAVSVFGGSPAMQVGASGKDITIGSGSNTNVNEAFSLVIGGSVTGVGVYEPKTSPNLPAPVSATGVLLGSADQTGTTTLSNGFHVQSTGQIVTNALSASSTGIHIANGVSMSSSSFINDGTVEALSTLNGGAPAPSVFTGSISGQVLTVTAQGAVPVQVGQVITGTGVKDGTVVTAVLSSSGGVSTYAVNQAQNVSPGSALSGAMTPQVNALVIDSGATVPSIINNRSLAASATATSTALFANVGGIVDYSGSVKNITNTGSISAVTNGTSNLYVTGGTDRAIDVRSSTAGTSIVQRQASPAQITGSISDTTLTVTAIAPGGQVQVGDTISGAGVAAGTQIVQLTGGNGGVGSTYQLSTSQTVSSETLSSGTPTSVFTGSISGNTLTVTAVTSGTLVPGQTISGPGIAPGTTITAIKSGTGGVGSYTVDTTQSVVTETVSAAVAPSISGDILFGKGANVLDIEAGRVTGAVTELPGERNLTVKVDNATLNITRAEAHPVTSLIVGSKGVLQATVDPSLAVGGSNPTPVFDTTVGAGQSGPDGKASFADGAQIGLTLNGLQSAQSATYVFVHTSGAGQLSVGNLGQTALADAPFLFSTTTSVNGGDLDVTLARKTAAQLGFNRSESAAYDAIFAALLRDNAAGAAIAAQTTREGLVGLYDQLVPDQGLGTFSALEMATQRVASLTETPPTPGPQQTAGSSLWLQEVNERVNRQTNPDTLGSSGKVLGLIGGYEVRGAGGGALGLTISYLNIQDESIAAAVGAHLVTNFIEGGVYYRRSFGNLRFSLRGAGGYAWFKDNREFLTTGLSESAVAKWTGFFADAHAGAAYEQRVFSRFYVRPELSADYLYLSENAHGYDAPADQVVNLNIARRTSTRFTGSAIVTFGAQFGQETWFRPEIFGGYRMVFASDLGDTVATFSGGLPFTLSPGNGKGGWITAGFALKAGTELSYVALVGDIDFQDDEQRYDIYLAGRTMF